MCLFLDAPSGAHAEIGQLRIFVVGIPALEHLIEALGQLIDFVVDEPIGLDQRPAPGYRMLLILTREVVFAFNAANLLQDLQRFALRVQRFPGRADVGVLAVGRPDTMRFFRLGNGRQREELPALLLEQVAHQVI